MDEDDRRRKRRRLIRGLLGPRFYQPKKPPTKLQVLRRQIFVGAFLWMGGLWLLGFVFHRPSLSAITSVFAVGGWLILMGLNLRYFYYFAFKKEDSEAEEETQRPRG
jgi:hypothetical protein